MDNKDNAVIVRNDSKLVRALLAEQVIPGPRSKPEYILGYPVRVVALGNVDNPHFDHFAGVILGDPANFDKRGPGKLQSGGAQYIGFMAPLGRLTAVLLQDSRLSGMVHDKNIGFRLFASDPHVVQYFESPGFNGFRYKAEHSSVPDVQKVLGAYEKADFDFENHHLTSFCPAGLVITFYDPKQVTG